MSLTFGARVQPRLTQRYHAHERLAQTCRDHPGVWFLMAMATTKAVLPSYMPTPEFELMMERSTFDQLGRVVCDVWVRYVGVLQTIAPAPPEGV